MKARQHISCHRCGRPRPIPPRDQAWVTGTAGLLTSASSPPAAFPEPLRPSGISERGSAATVAGAVAAWPIVWLTVFPFDPYAEPFPPLTLSIACRGCQFRLRCLVFRLRRGSRLRAGENSATSPLC
jgi:hypothetical protein